ncbi:SEC-C domain-containing protein [Candidatus Woesearchaeota archaeon]|nr:SEC-C domain-containing protein [Candidatus Woesearchaeota archaeon]
MAEILQNYNLDFFGPETIEKFEDHEHKNAKLGRNEQCHCGSGKKYKKCCLDEDIKKYGKAIKI